MRLHELERKDFFTVVDTIATCPNLTCKPAIYLKEHFKDLLPPDFSFENRKPFGSLTFILLTLCKIDRQTPIYLKDFPQCMLGPRIRRILKKKPKRNIDWISEYETEEILLQKAIEYFDNPHVHGIATSGNRVLLEASILSRKKIEKFQEDNNCVVEVSLTDNIISF